MNSRQALLFEGFRLDRRNQELRRDSGLVALRPKTFAVLQYLAENPARLITQEELLKAVWGPTAVGEGLLRGYIRDLRQALGDHAENPRFIETLPRRGFRFLSKVTIDTGGVENLAASTLTKSPHAPGLIGRNQELGSLHQLLSLALGGKRQVVLIAGEAGIGKTALLNAFLEQAAQAGAARIACGQCVEQYGTREAYLPIFDALGRLCSGEHASAAVAVLGQYAPSWLVQMPGLLSEDQYQTLQKRAQGTTQSRMLGEFCEALEALAGEQLLILGLEDLQWTDLATLDLLSILARREHRARLMVVGTYRPADVIVSEHPLRAVLHDLQAHQQCTELWPDYLTETGVETYLARRFPDHEFPTSLKRRIHRNTAGNPLFLTAVVDELVRDKSIESREGRWHLTIEVEKLNLGKSRSLRQLIEGQLSRLSTGEQRLLEVAAVLGSQFAADLVAVALEIDPVEVEEQFDALVRRHQVLRPALDGFGERADQRSRYEFLHDLYRTAAFDRSSPGRRRHWYKGIAVKLANDLGDRADEAGTELAFYFEHACMPLEAARYCALAGDRAARRFADSEARAQFGRGIELLKGVPESKERDAAELRLQVGLAPILIYSQGYETDDGAAAVSRASELNARLGDGDQTFAAVRGLYMILVGKPDYHAALELCDKMDRVAQNDPDPYAAAEALRLRGYAVMGLGRLAEARDTLTRAVAASRGSERSHWPTAFIEDIRATCTSVLGLIHWMLGYPDQATRLARQAVDRAVKLGGPFTTAYARRFRATIMRWLRNTAAVVEEAEAAIVICEQHGFQFLRMQASLDKGWAMAMQGRGAAAIREIRAALPFAPFTRSGAATILADVCLQLGKTTEGLRAVDDALEFVREHHEGSFEPELYRLKGELLLHSLGRRNHQRVAELQKAERYLVIAIEKAREIDAKSLELRATVSLYRLWSKLGKRPEAQRMLADVYNWFTEGKNTPDLIDARRILEKRRA
ncbi:MAG: AAA family ATPase, partial [Deltaproteobacteria bacterium]|nr:AAA family ATPase [Deltaproteobacteria bacterium]